MQPAIWTNGELEVVEPEVAELEVAESAPIAAAAEWHALSERAQGALAILSDLAVLSGNPRASPFRSPSLDRIQWVNCVWRSASKRAASWPVPRFRTIRDLESFRVRWTTLFEGFLATPGTDDAADLILRTASCWISACSEVLFDLPPMKLVPDQWTETLWRLFDTIEERVPESTDTSRIAESCRNWLVNLAAMLSPTTGFVKPDFPSALWFQIDANLTYFAQRCKRISEFWNERRSDISQRITSALKDVTWGQAPLQASLVALIGNRVHELGFFTSREALKYAEQGEWSFNPEKVAHEEQRQDAKRKSLHDDPNA